MAAALVWLGVAAHTYFDTCSHVELQCTDHTGAETATVVCDWRNPLLLGTALTFSALSAVAPVAPAAAGWCWRRVLTAVSWIVRQARRPTDRQRVAFMLQSDPELLRRAMGESPETPTHV